MLTDPPYGTMDGGYKFPGKKDFDKWDVESPGEKLFPLLARVSSLDFTMGSGSTGVAAVNTGRNFIGMELDAGYFETAKRRIEEAKEQLRIVVV